MTHTPPALGGARGKFSTSAHENVIPSLNAAPSFATAVYVTARLTSDSVPVLMHDETVDRTTDGTGSVSSFTLAGIQALDAGDGATVPSLQEYLDAIATLEGSGHRDFDHIIVQVVAAADASDVYSVTSAHSLAGRIEFITRSSIQFSTGRDTADAIRALDSDVPLGSFITRNDNLRTMVDAAREVGATYLFANPGSTGYSANPDLVRRISDQFGIEARVSRTSDLRVLLSTWTDPHVTVQLTFDVDSQDYWLATHLPSTNASHVVAL